VGAVFKDSAACGVGVFKGRVGKLPGLAGAFLTDYADLLVGHFLLFLLLWFTGFWALIVFYKLVLLL
jgi:hypothetical protein